MPNDIFGSAQNSNNTHISSNIALHNYLTEVPIIHSLSFSFTYELDLEILEHPPFEAATHSQPEWALIALLAENHGLIF